MTIGQVPFGQTRRRIGLATACLSILVTLAGCDDDANVRACLKKNGAGLAGQDHTYMNEVVSVRTLKSYPDGRATRAVSYRVSNASGIRKTTCLW